MTTIVLGWDGLDYDLVHEIGVAGAFGAECSRLDTIRNDVIGKPHTYELWPSIVTGLAPDDHGIHAERYTHGGSWSNPVLNAAARLSKFTVPEAVRWRVGRLIRDHGATFEFESLEYYAQHGITTVFDGRQSFPLGIPNCRSRPDVDLEIMVDRGAHLAAFMDIETGPDGETIHNPSVPLGTFHHRLEADLASKLGAVRSAYRSGYDLIFVWLGYLDTVGHVAPTVKDPEAWVRSGYDTAAAWTAFLREHTDASDTVFCVSDHGLQNGEHTEHAFAGSWPGEHASGCDHVLDVADVIEATSPRSTGLTEPHTASDRKADYDAVEGRLQDLGYLDG